MAGGAPGPLTSDVVLRDVAESDLPIFFEQQLDPGASHMAAFTARNPADRDAFMARWRRTLGDESIIKRTILFDGRVAGNVVSFELSGEREVGYWIAREYWGKGVATRALSMVLAEVETRPLYAHVAKDNIASIRVLQKCGFEVYGEGKEFSNARGEEVEKVILQLRSGAASPQEGAGE